MAHQYFCYCHACICTPAVRLFLFMPDSVSCRHLSWKNLHRALCWPGFMMFIQVTHRRQ